ncbi:MULTISPECIES: tryptophan transporter [Clostridium]|uniref:Tryptophan transporter n=1 Tax=Clostridium cibarium TaxID=2762247 RepID=A0ABR8PX77_9CLOT|nr:MULTISPECIES: tryptophan transporter [Clostridium]MBD7912760.1 tryptophan transporter [Clostridium cibarium]
MNTKKMIINAILIAIGVILHISAPSIGLPAQPDFAVAMLFIIMILNKDYKTTLFAGIIIGIFTAMTTKTPGGQLPNILDKLITCNVMYFVLLPLRDKINKNIQAAVVLLFGTMLSGLTFLLSLATIYGIEGSILVPIVAVVVPTSLVNLVVGVIIYKIVERAIKQTKFKMN